MGTPSTPPGQLVAGKYRILCQIGEGGMGEVLLAVHEPLGAKVAVKVLSASGRTSADRKRFLLEAQAAAQLKSEHVAHVTDFGSLDDGRQYMVLEYLEGEDLAARLHHRGRLPIAEAVDFVIQACAGLAEAHASGIIHRDIKPSNLFVTSTTDGSEIVKVLDFGVSKFELAQGEHALTSTGLAVGTPLYMSPEQVKTKKVIDARTDVWSLGVVLYELCRGKTPFYDDSLGLTLLNVLEKPFVTLRDSGVELSEELESIVNACLSKEPDGRPESVLALGALLAPFASADGKRLAGRLPAIAARARSRVLVSLPPSALAEQQTTLRVLPLPSKSDPEVESRPGATPPDGLRTGTVPLTQSRFIVPVVVVLALLAVISVAVWWSRSGASIVVAQSATSEAPTAPISRSPPSGDRQPTAPTIEVGSSVPSPPPTSSAIAPVTRPSAAARGSARPTAAAPSATSERPTLF